MARQRKPMTTSRSTQGLTKLEEGPAAMDEVAAHQAVCSCHPGKDSTVRGKTKAACCDDSGLHARDSSQREWHLDPLCKRRPEAACR